MDILIPCHIGFLPTFEVFGHFSFYGFCLGSLHIMDFIATYRGSEILLVVFGHIFRYGFFLVTRNGSCLVASNIVNLPASDGIGLTTGNDIFLTAFHGIGLFSSNGMFFFASHFGRQSTIVVFFRCSSYCGSQLAAYGIRHIAACLVHDVLCIVCDGAVFRRIGDIFCGLLGLRNSSIISNL